MRVLISTSTLPLDDKDPQPRFVLDLARSLADQQCRVTTLAPDRGVDAVAEPTRVVETQRFRYFYPRSWQRLADGGGMRANLQSRPLTWLQVPSFFISQALALRRLIQREPIDVVNSHWMVPQGLTSAWVRGSRPRFRHVLSVHAGDVYLLEKIPGGAAIARYVLSRTDAVFCDGSHVNEALNRLVGRDTMATIQPMGVDLQLFQDSPELPPEEIPFAGGFLVFVGRFAEKKGVAYLLEAMPKVLEHYPYLGLVLIGYGLLEDELRQQISRLGIQDSVLLTGGQPHRVVTRYLRSCRLAVVPSIVDSHGETEGMPTVVIEALASPCRVVASAVDGIPDIIEHGVNGWLCRQKDPEDLAEKILDALADPSPSSVLDRASTTANRHSWEQVAARYVQSFGRNLEGGPREGGSGSTRSTCRE